jgi:hypothetical protein
MDLTDFVLSEGQLVKDHTEDTAMAERSWLQLWHHFMRHNEFEKAATIPIPWTLYGRPRVLGYSNQSLGMMQKIESDITREKLLAARAAFLNDALTPEDAEAAFATAKNNEITRWIMGHVVADNPTSILDCESRFGELSMEMAKLDVPVTVFMPFEQSASKLKGFINEQNLPIKIVHNVFEGHDFDDAKFDTVIVRDLMAYTPNDRVMLECACQLANKSVIITCVEGSLGRGFLCEDSKFKNVLASQRRCFTRETMEEMVLQTLEDPKYQVEIITVLDQRYICMYIER